MMGGGELKQRESIEALYLIVNIMYNHENKFIGGILKLHWGTGPCNWESFDILLSLLSLPK